MKKLFGLMILFCSIAAPGATGAPPKHLKKAAKALDESDPVQVAIYKVLASYPTFEDVLGPAYSDGEQQAYIDKALAAPDIADRGKMARLQILEVVAPTLRHVNVAIEGAAEGEYSEQNSVQSRATQQSIRVGWLFAVPDDETENTARRLISSIEALLGKDRKWKDISGEMSTGAPGWVSHVMHYDLSSFMSKTKQYLWVKIDYGIAGIDGVLLSVWSHKTIITPN
jgi:hypothetical protein